MNDDNVIKSLKIMENENDENENNNKENDEIEI